MIPISKPCHHAGCSATVQRGRYCAAHLPSKPSAVYDATRRKDDPALAMAAKIRGSARWQRFRAWFKQRHPICCDPFHEHEYAPAAMQGVHHVLGLAAHPEQALSEDNCRPLCVRCHNKIEAMERAGQSTQHLFDGTRDAA